ncbi:hypothetical protein DPMN_029861 [Dreissena polymorpha]|uniref:Dscam n=1 Tax=Dreissena polymorpha TaxID=45954 RepID=A0A9D4RHJ3_DREPO|nr:hypothetical protein DPMN_029861 [Dreissena polymorpha]
MYTFTETNQDERPADGRILDNGDLLIGSAHPSHTGLYSCNASNSHGFITASAQLTVYGKVPVIFCVKFCAKICLIPILKSMFSYMTA